MTLLLGDYVVRGEIINTEPYSTHGFLELRGCDRPLVFQLTGDCTEDLRGKHVRFAATRVVDNAVFEDDGIAWQQVGPTSEITANRRVRIAGTPPDDGRTHVEPELAPPFEWARCLYIEWHGQNGRVVVQIPDPLLEFVDPEDEWDNQERWSPSNVDDMYGLEPPHDEDRAFRHDDPSTSDEGDDDPYGLFPEGFESQFESEAAETDRLIGSSSNPNSADSMQEIELLDELIENGEGDPIATIFDTPLRLRHPDKLEDDELEAELKSLLAQLALYGIAVDVCEHFSPRDTYVWLLEEIVPKECAYPELRRTQWIQHFSTSDDCAECDADFEIELDGLEDEADGETRDDDLSF